MKTPAEIAREIVQGLGWRREIMAATVAMRPADLTGLENDIATAIAAERARGVALRGAIDKAEDDYNDGDDVAVWVGLDRARQAFEVDQRDRILAQAPAMHAVIADLAADDVFRPDSAYGQRIAAILAAVAGETES